jgi:hypothetical protein
MKVTEKNQPKDLKATPSPFPARDRKKVGILQSLCNWELDLVSEVECLAQSKRWVNESHSWW